jgi:hypothetical protein
MKWPRIPIAVAAVAAMFAVVVQARGESCSLELKRLESRSRYEGVRGGTIEMLVRYTNSQSFYMQTGPNVGEMQMSWPDGTTYNPKTEFAKAIKQQPKYASDRVVRGVVKLGGQVYGFALDSVPAKEEKPKDEKAKDEKAKDEKAKDEKPKEKAAEKSTGKTLLSAVQSAVAGGAAPAKELPKATVYNRLYFDVNHNGDLTDDKPVDAMPLPEQMRAMMMSSNAAQCDFPRIDLTLDLGDAKLDYSFTMNVYSYSYGENQSYVSGSLSAAAYREGEITLEGKKRKVILVDFNCNGRFDDQLGLRNVQSTDGQIYPLQGDTIAIDPDLNTAGGFSPYDLSSGKGRYNVSKLLCLEGKYFDMKVTPAGDKLELTPSNVEIGNVTNPNAKYRALIYGDKGVVMIAGEKGSAVPIPVGEWKLLNYTIDLTGAAPEKKPDEKKESSLLGALSKALIEPARPQMVRNTMVAASATKAGKPVTVRKGETTLLAFGPPYKPVVKVQYRPSKDQVQLNMSLVGSAGEIVSNMMVEGNRPEPAPKFTISSPKGEVVQTGQFSYG